MKTTIKNPSPKPLSVATISTDSGTVTVPCEPVNEWLAITPVFGMDRDGNTFLEGTFTITHQPTGIKLADGCGCIVCARNAGKAIAELGIDWSGLGMDHDANTAWFAGLPEETKRDFQMVRDVEWLCDANYCQISTKDSDSADGLNKASGAYRRGFEAGEISGMTIAAEMGDG